MNRRTVTGAALGVVVWALAGGPSTRADVPCPEVLVPAYQYPTDGAMWANLAASAATARLSVILNPDSGPGAAIDPNYTTVVANARTAGAKIYGYVDTNYAARSSMAVLADVNAYLSFYPMDGIFLDQMSDSIATLGYYQNLTTAIHGLIPGGRVIGNPGTTVPEAFVSGNAADVIVTYENDATNAAEPYATFAPPAWTANYPAERFANIVYHVPDEATMTNYLDLSSTRNVGLVYFTNDVLPNPYDTLPPYWDELALFAPLPISILGQPGSTSVCAGGTADFSVNAVGAAPRFYQWQWRPTKPAGLPWQNVVSGINLDPGGVPAFTASPLGGPFNLRCQNVAIPALAAKNELRCIVSNGCGSLTSAPATMTVIGQGDLNFDCAVVPVEVNAFVLALVNPTGYAAAFPACNRQRADVNGDTRVDGADIATFVRMLVAP